MSSVEYLLASVSQVADCDRSVGGEEFISELLLPR